MDALIVQVDLFSGLGELPTQPRPGAGACQGHPVPEQDALLAERRSVRSRRCGARWRRDRQVAGRPAGRSRRSRSSEAVSRRGPVSLVHLVNRHDTSRPTSRTTSSRARPSTSSGRPAGRRRPVLKHPRRVPRHRPRATACASSTSALDATERTSCHERRRSQRSAPSRCRSPARRIRPARIASSTASSSSSPTAPTRTR